MSEERDVEVMSLGYRIMHAVNLILFASLMVSGAMLYALEATSWFAYGIGQPLTSLLGSNTDPVVAGVQWARTWHRVVGIAWGVMITFYAVYTLLFSRVSVFDGLRKPFRQQLREAKALMKMYLLGEPLPEDVKRGIGRHNVLVGYLFILLLVAVVLVSISGVLLVYAEPLALSTGAIRLLYLLHDIGFALSILFFLLHTFAVLMPQNRPLLVAMFSSGRIPVRWLREHMPLYLREGRHEA
ncbi:MAG: cytochrome b/b6 domain-containing protein [Desulfurococcales archaeon]|nr:cytochrome b/b6 domain-containing protein [Desulfurococcales archaeon]